MSRAGCCFGGQSFKPLVCGLNKTLIKSLICLSADAWGWVPSMWLRLGLVLGLGYGLGLANGCGLGWGLGLRLGLRLGLEFMLGLGYG